MSEPGLDGQLPSAKLSLVGRPSGRRAALSRSVLLFAVSAVRALGHEGASVTVGARALEMDASRRRISPSTSSSWLTTHAGALNGHMGSGVSAGMIRTPRLSMVLLVTLGPACRTVETAPGLDLAPADQTAVSGAVATAAFWAPSCDPKKIVVQRVDEYRQMVELSVCGDVRRYQRIPVAQGSGTAWLDVTFSTKPRPAPRS